MRRSACALVAVAIAACSTASASAAQKAAGPVLEGRAVLPADTFAAGPSSGAALAPGPVLGRTVPFPGQPVQGFSALVRRDATTFWALADNGYGTKANSADFHLRVYPVAPALESTTGGSGTVAVGQPITLRDPDRHVPFAIVDGTSDRVLTGADFDPESLAVTADGHLWIGDEFGPWILHFDATGKLAEPPLAVPGLRSPDNPTFADPSGANVPRSGGFEAMTLTSAGTVAADCSKPTPTPTPPSLVIALERALVGETDPRRRLLYRLIPGTRALSPAPAAYRTESAEHYVSDLAALDADRLVAIERDGRAGAGAMFKRVFVVDLRKVDANGFLVKQEVLDLLRIRDPARLSLPARAGEVGLGDPFSFPYVTTEAILPLDAARVMIVNDNNYVSAGGRGPDFVDDTEIISVRLDGLCSRTPKPRR